VVTVTNYVTVAAASPEPAPVQPVAPPEPAPEETIRGTIGDFVRGHAPDSQYSPPSVLVRFFTQSPDSTVGTVVVPVGFVPPANTAPVPRSSATYQKGP
jgi:hypothetical protein